MRTPEQQVTQSMWRLWQLGSPFHWLSNLKVQIERGPEAVYFIRSQGKCRIQLPSVFLGGRQKVCRALFLSEAQKRKEKAHTKQNKTPYTPQNHPPITPRTINLTFPTVSLRPQCCYISRIALALKGLKGRLRVLAFKKCLIFHMRWLFWYKPRKNYQVRISYDLLESTSAFCISLSSPSSMGQKSKFRKTKPHE